MLVHCRVTPSIKFAGTHLYAWVEGGTVRVKYMYLAQEHSTMFPARAQTLTTWAGSKCINHEAFIPLLQFTVEVQILMFLLLCTNARILPCWQLFYNIQFQLTVSRCIPFNGVHVCAFIWNGNSVFQVFPSLIHFNLLRLCSFMPLLVFLFSLLVCFYFSNSHDELVSAEISKIKFLGKMFVMRKFNLHKYFLCVGENNLQASTPYM